MLTRLKRLLDFHILCILISMGDLLTCCSCSILVCCLSIFHAWLHVWLAHRSGLHMDLSNLTLFLRHHNLRGRALRNLSACNSRRHLVCGATSSCSVHIAARLSLACWLLMIFGLLHRDLRRHVRDTADLLIWLRNENLSNRCHTLSLHRKYKKLHKMTRTNLWTCFDVFDQL